MVFFLFPALLLLSSFDATGPAPPSVSAAQRASILARYTGYLGPHEIAEIALFEAKKSDPLWWIDPERNRRAFWRYQRIRALAAGSSQSVGDFSSHPDLFGIRPLYEEALSGDAAKRSVPTGMLLDARLRPDLFPLQVVLENYFREQYPKFWWYAYGSKFDKAIAETVAFYFDGADTLDMPWRSSPKVTKAGFVAFFKHLNQTLLRRDISDEIYGIGLRQFYATLRASKKDDLREVWLELAEADLAALIRHKERDLQAFLSGFSPDEVKALVNAAVASFSRVEVVKLRSLEEVHREFETIDLALRNQKKSYSAYPIDGTTWRDQALPTPYGHTVSMIYEGTDINLTLKKGLFRRSCLTPQGDWIFLPKVEKPMLVRMDGRLSFFVDLRTVPVQAARIWMPFFLFRGTPKTECWMRATVTSDWLLSSSQSANGTETHRDFFWLGEEDLEFSYDSHMVSLTRWDERFSTYLSVDYQFEAAKASIVKPLSLLLNKALARQALGPGPIKLEEPFRHQQTLVVQAKVAEDGREDIHKIIFPYGHLEQVKVGGLQVVESGENGYFESYCPETEPDGPECHCPPSGK